MLSPSIKKLNGIIKLPKDFKYKKMLMESIITKHKIDKKTLLALVK